MNRYLYLFTFSYLGAPNEKVYYFDYCHDIIGAELSILNFLQVNNPGIEFRVARLYPEIGMMDIAFGSMHLVIKVSYTTLTVVEDYVMEVKNGTV